MRRSRSIRVAALAICWWMGVALLSALVVTDTALGCDGDGPGMADPAAVYCGELGYEYKIVDTDQGQYGICAFPDGSECSAWEFLEGKCGQGYSYCARQGYDLIVKSDGRNPFSKDYSVCVRDQQEIGAVTELMDLREKATRGAFPVEQKPSPPEEGAPPPPGLPASFNWRNHNGGDWMTPVQAQGNCGSCWAFSAVGVVEAAYNISRGDPDLDCDLSEEYLVSGYLARDNKINTCCGGWNNEALIKVRDSGVPDDACLPYVDGDDPGGCPLAGCTECLDCTYRAGSECSDKRYSVDRCGDWQARLKRIVSTGPVPSAQATIKQYVVERGPLAVSLDMDGGFVGDIYKCTSPDFVNHAVVIAGYDDAGSYWIVKNSWGDTWNGDGYFKVGYGECLIETAVFYAVAPTVVGIDVEPTGNTATSLATIDRCVEVGVGTTFDIDVFLNDVPCIDVAPADSVCDHPTRHNLGGYQYNLWYDEDKLRVNTTNHNGLITDVGGMADGGDCSPMGAPCPDVDGNLLTSVTGLGGEAQAEPWGSLGRTDRYQMEVVGGAGTLTFLALLNLTYGGYEPGVTEWTNEIGHVWDANYAPQYGVIAIAPATCPASGGYPPVGGLAELPDLSGSSGPPYAPIAGAAAATALALTAGGWYARRRWLG